MSGHVFQLVFHFFVGHVDIFGRGDAIDDQFRLHVIDGAVFVAASAGVTQSTFTARGIHALRRQRTHHALQAHIHLMLDQRFGYREVVQLHDFGQDFFAQQILVLVIALVFQAFANFLVQLVQRGGVAHILGELVVQLRAVSCS